MMERALKVKAMFLVYATHIDLPDSYNLVRPAITKTFTIVQEIYRHTPNNLYADVFFPAATGEKWKEFISVRNDGLISVKKLCWLSAGYGIG